MAPLIADQRKDIVSSDAELSKAKSTEFNRVAAFFCFHWSFTRCLSCNVAGKPERRHRGQLSPPTHASRFHHAEVAGACYGVMSRYGIGSSACWRCSGLQKTSK